MGEIRWTLQAAADLESITEYIAENSPHYACLFAIDVLSAVEQLTDFPHSGRIVPELAQADIRELLFGSYRIIYRVKNEIVEILTIFHGARLLDPSNLR
jgi:plasmid stabilization system protein ParE